MLLDWPRRAVFLLAVSTGLGLPMAAAAEWAPATFAPQIGSRWRIHVEDNTTYGASGTTRNLVYQYNLTYAARDGAGYSIVYTLLDASVKGSAPSVLMARAAIEALRGVIVRAVTDAAGTPLKVVNEEPVRGIMRTLTQQFLIPYRGNTQISHQLSPLFDGLLTATGAAAVDAFLYPLPILASAQNTTLKPGEERRGKSELAGPSGDRVAAISVSRLGPDPKAEKYTVIEAASPAEASAKAAVAALTERAASAGSGSGLAASVPEASLLRARMIEVEDGMTRAAFTQEVTAGGGGESDDQVRVVTVKVIRIP